ncbi:unnamed protein product [Ascophyllum nodosum]
MVPSPFARILAQLAVASAGIVSRAFVSAYSQAVHNARRGTQESAKSMSRTSKMSTQEALQILNLQKAEMKPDFVRKKFDQYFEINDPSKGGSFYLQSKVFRAREALDEQLSLLAKQAAQDAAMRAKANRPSAGAGTTETGGTGARAGAARPRGRREGANRTSSRR